MTDRETIIAAVVDGLREVVDEKFRNFDEKLDIMGGDVTRIDGKVTRIDENIRGNGRPGLNERMNNAERFIKALTGVIVFIVSAIATAKLNGWLG